MSMHPCTALCHATPRCAVQDADGNLPLHLAAKFGHPALVPLIADALASTGGSSPGADASGAGGEAGPSLSPKVQQAFKTKNRDSWTPLHVAAAGGRAAAALALVQVRLPPGMGQTGWGGRGAGGSASRGSGSCRTPLRTARVF